WVHGINAYLYEDKIMKAANTWFDALPTQVEVVTKNDDGTDGFKRKTLGTVVVTLAGWRLNVAWQPAKLDPSARELIDAAARLLGDDARALNTFDTLVSEPFDAMLKRLTATAVAEGGWEQDPTQSAPDVVAAVTKAEGLSSEGATLWLQLMALLDPTKKACIQWNGWSPKTYAAAAAELVERGLVVEGKRARAGREHFLPGGWVESKDILPYEEWKRPLYGWEAATGRFPIGNPVALEPLHRLFERAWQRCVAGDRPRFEEVRR
ncbi:MAG: hypothetical protein KC621_30720, partial [Myxococcales bacterium]|nr:hypothetical protein [Myxococcales bacterium]